MNEILTNHEVQEQNKTSKGEIALIPKWTIQLDLEQVNFLGYVSGVSIEGISLGKEIFAGIKDLTGGRIARYEERHKTTENEAIEEILEEAYNLGADAIIDFEIDNNTGIEGYAFSKASGIAVKLKNDNSKLT